MTDPHTIGLPEAANRLGVSVRVLRQAIRVGKLSAPGPLTATVAVPADWLATTKATVKADPKIFSSVRKQAVPPFARYVGTSCWRKYRSRVREFNAFHAA